MDKAKTTNYLKMPIIKASYNFVEKYLGDNAKYFSISNSHTSKANSTDKDKYSINFSYISADELIPAFLLDDNYLEEIKKDFSKWCSKSVNYLKFTWNFSACSEEQEKNKEITLDCNLEVRMK